jgi:hypothetical protein
MIINIQYNNIQTDVYSLQLTPNKKNNNPNIKEYIVNKTYKISD